MKILMAGNYYYPEHIGGIEVVADSLTENYRRMGHEVHWIAADVPPNFRVVKKDDRPLRSWNFFEAKLGFPYPFPGLSAIPIMWNEVKWCEVIHMHDCLYLSNILIFLFAIFNKKPVLLQQHAKIIPYQQAYKRWLQILAYNTIGRLVFKYVDRIIFVTSLVYEEMTRFIANKSIVGIIINGIDTDFYAPISPEKKIAVMENLGLNSQSPLFLFVGRLVERKGAHLIRPIIKNHPEWNWVLVGRPDDIDPQSWNYPNLVHLSNIPRSNLRDLYAAADILIHPSVGEGITLVVQEAMACGTPVIISNESLYNIDQEDIKFFIPTHPETAGLETALVQTINKNQELRKLRGEIRNYAIEKMSWQSASIEYLKLLESICKK